MGNMNEFEKAGIEAMEIVLLGKYKAIINENSILRQDLLKAEKDAMIATLEIIGYTVSYDVDKDLKIKAFHITK